MGNNGIYVILDLHACGQNWFKHNREYGNVIWDKKSLQNRVTALWKTLAKRYKNYSCIAAYNIINEPTAPNKDALRKLYQKLIYEIRKHDKQHIIILESDAIDNKIGYGGEYIDENIMLSQHFYRPAKFTFQGSNGIPIGFKYPGVYDGYYFDKKTLEYFFELMEEENPKGRPIYIGEFGANVWYADKDAALWITDVIDILNKKGMHFTYFQYKSLSKNSSSTLSPSQEIEDKISKLNRLLRKTTDENKIISLAKDIYMTENYLEAPYLKNILLKGFTQTPLMDY